MTDSHGKCEKGDCGHIVVLVPEHKTPADLRMSELDIASRKLGTDVLSVLNDEHNADGTPAPKSPLRYKALMWLAWLWARRTNPAAEFKTFEDMEIDELNHALGRHRPQEPEDPSGPSGEESESD